jgi:CRISPR system Cascade subunit CasD
MSRDWLLLRLEAPLMAFGAEAVDQVGPTRDFPGTSQLTGLLGNALGWRWQDREAHAALQARLVWAAALLREGRRITDSQNARLFEDDIGWTTRGAPEGRKPSPSYAQRDASGRKYLTHRRRRDYVADAAVLAALGLRDGAGPTLDDLERALDRPARPLFIGRKPCLPSGPILWCRLSSATAFDALDAWQWVGSRRALWPEGEGPEGDRLLDLADLRNWMTGLAGGSRRVVEGRL